MAHRGGSRCPDVVLGAGGRRPRPRCPASARTPAGGQQELGHWDLRYTPSAGALDAALDFGGAGTLPVVGDWNSDGTTDFGTMTAAQLGNSLFRLRTASGPIEFRFGTGVIPVSGDFNGDHKADIGTYMPPTDSTAPAAGSCATASPPAPRTPTSASAPTTPGCR